MRTFAKASTAIALSATLLLGSATAAIANTPENAASIKNSGFPTASAISTINDPARPQAVPVIGGAVILGCVASVGLSAYQAYKGGDPVEYVAGAIIGCIPFGSAAKPAVVAFIKANKGAIAKALKALGATALASALSGDSAR